MKAVIALVVLLTSLVSWADTIKLLEFRETFDRDVHSVGFKVNKPLKRAWVEVSIGETFGDETHYDDTNVKVPGLSYDADINGVVFDNGTEVIVCGTFYNRRWVIDGGMSFRETGRCEFETKRIVKTVDDGFNVRKVKMIEVLLNIQ